MFEDELKAHVRIWLPRIADGSEGFWIREPMKHDSGERDQGRDRHTYVEPSAFIEYKKSGKWPDGTQIVKELSLIKTGGNCGKNTLACSTPVGAGIFEDSFIGIGMMVKDRRRYPTAPGNWAYFRLFAHNSAYMATSSVLAPNQFQSCHVKFASKEDDVFTDTYIGLTSQIVH